MTIPAIATPDQQYAFAERIGICIDSHATVAEAERIAYVQVFGIEPEVEVDSSFSPRNRS